MLKASIDKREIAPLEICQAEVTIQWSGTFTKAEILFPGLRTSNNLALIATATVSSAQEKEGELILQRKYTYTLQGKDAGVGVIEPVTVQYALEPGEPLKTITSAALEITISRIYLDFSKKSKKIIGLASLMILLLIAGTPLVLIIRIKQKGKARLASLAGASPSFEDQALQLLSEAEKYRQSGDLREYHTHIAATLKGYLAKKYGINTTGKTTLMILDEISGAQVDEELKRRIDTILCTCDRAKFAHYEPGVEEMDRIYTLTRDFILQGGQNSGL
ncbi:MAG: BatD family protein [bacterium]